VVSCQLDVGFQPELGLAESEPSKEGERGVAGEEGAGCVALISSGTSGEESAFMECTTSSPCTQEAQAPPECETAEGCRAAPEPQPSIYTAPASATFNGLGNPTPEAPAPAVKKKVVKKTVRCAKGKVRNKGGGAV
jgi:hypothetical protein